MELIFYDSRSTLRENGACSHSLHQEQAHFFAQKDVVAMIK